MAQIPLHGRRGAGRVTLIDDEDLARFSTERWLLHSDGYAVRAGGVYLHRAILAAPSGVEVDHANGDRLDNRRANLRLASHAENVRNGRCRRVGSSGFRGVNRKGASYLARITVEGRRIEIGRFATPEAAAAARDEAAKRLHRSFAVLNGIDVDHEAERRTRVAFTFEGERMSALAIAERVGCDAKTVYAFAARGVPLERLTERLPNQRTRDERIALVRELLVAEPDITIKEVARRLRLRKGDASAFVKAVRDAGV